MIRRTYITQAFVLVSTLSAVPQEKKVDRASLPAAVKQTIQEQSNGATIKGFTTEREHGKQVYEAEMMVNGHSKDIEIAKDGSLIEIEEEVPFASLPSSVRDSLTAKAAGAKITKVESLTKHDQLVAYEAATLEGMKKGEIQVGPSGNKLSHDE